MSGDKYETIRLHLKEEFKNISNNELRDVIRCFSNIKNLLDKPIDRVDPNLIRNKCIPLLNTLDKSFIRKKLRKETKQENHERLNSLLLISGISNIEKDVPYCSEYFKFLMRK